MATLQGSVVRRQELTCTEEELALYGAKILLENEVLRVRMNDGSVREKIGDGNTSVAKLPYLGADLKNIDELLKAGEEHSERLAEHAERLTDLSENTLHNGFRIASVEESLGISEPFVSVTNAGTGYRTGLAQPTGARPWVRIAKLWGTHGTAMYSEEDQVYSIPDFPQYLWCGTTNIFQFPAASDFTSAAYDFNKTAIDAIAPDYGMDEVNYIYSEGEKWYYHQGGRFHEAYINFESDLEYLPLEEDETAYKWWEHKGGYFAELKEPIVTDITDKLSASPYVMCGGQGAIGAFNNVTNSKEFPLEDGTYWTTYNGCAHCTIDFEV